MKKLIAYSHQGYKIAVAPSDSPPYVRVVMTGTKYESSEEPLMEDYMPWQDAIKHVESENKE